MTFITIAWLSQLISSTNFHVVREISPSLTNDKSIIELVPALLNVPLSSFISASGTKANFPRGSDLWRWYIYYPIRSPQR